MYSGIVCDSMSLEMLSGASPCNAVSNLVGSACQGRGGSSKSIDRGSADRVNGASGVFRMREKGTRRSGGRKSPSGVQGQRPGRGSGVPQKLTLIY